MSLLAIAVPSFLYPPNFPVFERPFMLELPSYVWLRTRTSSPNFTSFFSLSHFLNLTLTRYWVVANKHPWDWIGFNFARQEKTHAINVHCSMSRVAHYMFFNPKGGMPSTELWETEDSKSFSIFPAAFWKHDAATHHSSPEIVTCVDRAKCLQQRVWWIMPVLHLIPL